ncbi:hypothetical protein [Marinococcus halophilus]|uniref:hypothetical protein n=1 Tax=Marinococcus halophilus TaxID=1371 RepID=UPI0009A82FFF|nr:hypothetical protein [Marinococcus halophilus]
MIASTLDAGRQKIAALPTSVRFSLLISFLLSALFLFLIFPQTFIVVTIITPMVIVIGIFLIYAMAYILLTLIKIALGVITFILLFIGLSHLLF